MNLNTSNLSHPRMQWEIQAAMWRAKDESLLSDESTGGAYACNAAGKPVVYVFHDRTAVPAFAFYIEPYCHNITTQVLKVLRASV